MFIRVLTEFRSATVWKAQLHNCPTELWNNFAELFPYCVYDAQRSESRVVFLAEGVSVPSVEHFVTKWLSVA